MRLLHTSDWHLGRTFHGVPLLAHQVRAIEAMVELVRDEHVDVVVIAGDLYDRQLPPVDAVEAFSHALAELRGAGAQVVAIAGNHDSAGRVAFGSPLLARAGVHIRGDMRAAGQPVLISATDDGPDLACYPIPYLEPEVARHGLEAPDARSHDAVLGVALDRARADLAQRGPARAVAIAHAFVAGGQPCDSERVLAVGGAERVAPRCFAGFDYVALGHLHGRQTLGDGRLRYSGSPVAYSFSERTHTKGVWLVDLPAARTPQVEFAPLPVPRRLAAIRGELKVLLTSREFDAVEDHWVQATLTDQVLPREAMARLRQRFPHAVTLTHEPPRRPGAGEESYRERVAGRDDLALVEAFLEHVTGRTPVEDERQVCREAIDAALRAEVA